jgi:hypothetical protein
MNDFERTVDIIRSTVVNNEYNDRLPYIMEARNRVLHEYNLFAMLDHEISGRNASIGANGTDGVIMCRQTMKFRKPLLGLRREAEKMFTKVRHIHW